MRRCHPVMYTIMYIYILNLNQSLTHFVIYSVSSAAVGIQSQDVVQDLYVSDLTRGEHPDCSFADQE